MDKKQSQKTFVKQELAKHGFITRNKCIRNYISRLSAIIFDLKDDGIDMETKIPCFIKVLNMYYEGRKTKDKQLELFN